MTTPSPRVTVIGLGYVGLPLAVALAKQFETCGLDIDTRRIDELKSGHDRTGEIDRDRMEASSLTLTADPAACPPSDFYIVTVPTPIDGQNRPDLGLVEKASRTVARMIAPAVAEGRAPVIVYESTVYPGVTEDLCAPILEEVSGLVCGKDFFLGYSPERINPGDREHTIDKITKVVSGQTPEVLDRVANLYNAITSGGVFRAKSIKAAGSADRAKIKAAMATVASEKFDGALGNGLTWKDRDIVVPGVMIRWDGTGDVLLYEGSAS